VDYSDAIRYEIRCPHCKLIAIYLTLAQALDGDYVGNAVIRHEQDCVEARLNNVRGKPLISHELEIDGNPMTCKINKP